MKVKSESEVAQSCPTLATPWTAAHQAPPSMGFSRQEYWSGVSLPSSVCSIAATAYDKSLQSCPTLCDPIDGSPPGCPVPGILQARTLEWLPFPPSGDLPNPGIEPESLMSPALQGSSLPLVPPGGEGNGTPLQYSCLANPMDGGAW